MEDFDDISFSSKTGAVFMSAAGSSNTDDFNKSSTAPVLPTPYLSTFVSPWGIDNRYPYEIADDLKNSGLLAAAMDGKARITIGKGPQAFFLTNISPDGKEELEYCHDSEIQDFFELNDIFDYSYEAAYDHLAYGWNCGSFVLNAGKNKIVRLKRHDVFEARLEKKDPKTKQIPYLYLCSDWRLSGVQYNPDREARIALLADSNELADLQKKVLGNSKTLEYGFTNRNLRNGSQYYPIPNYRSAKAWISIGRSIPAFKKAMFTNQMTVKFLVSINPKFWQDKYGQLAWDKYTPEQKKEKREEYREQIDCHLAGEENAYKSIFTGGYTDSTGKFIPYVQIEKIDNTIPGGEFLLDSGAANMETLFALGVNPSQLGAGNPGGKAYAGDGGGSNIREGYLTALMQAEPDRRRIAAPLDVIKKFNGWSKRLEKPRTIVSATGENSPQSRMVTPRLVFRNPTGLLTTLDTGKSTKTETT